MESKEFDASLGGSEQLPISINSLKFTASRSVEIAAMTESILNPSKVRLVFQTLPVHMRRRVMSHNSKRLPLRLRKAHLEQLKKSGLPPKQKKPSRKYRRRPQNLLKDYNRRKLRNIWLETHIWHAKRFHMTNRWGHRLPEAPCDKMFRACYRATSKHCLLQDFSYYTHIQITGDTYLIKDMFSVITNASISPSIDGKAYTNGTRQGEIHIYEPYKFPYGYIGKVSFLWETHEDPDRTLWLFVHPSQLKQVEQCFYDIQNPVKELVDIDNKNVKRRKMSTFYAEHIKIKYLPESFNHYRLTGPNSHAVLVNSLKCVEDIENIKSNCWVEKYIKNNSNFNLKVKAEYWNSISPAQSPAQLSPNIVVGLIVRDPRLMRPTYRTKAENDLYAQLSKESLTRIPPAVSTSPLWSTDIHPDIKLKVKTNGEFIQHMTKLNLVPGEVYENDPELQSVPVVLIQRPGSQETHYKKLGYGCGWDIMVPSGYGLPFWQTFIMFGARAGGLRETESLTLEMGETFLPPDSAAGKANDTRIELELKEKYFKLPPKKRVNYIKLGINSPFSCPWKLLLKDWYHTAVNDFYVLRDRVILANVQESLKFNKVCKNLEINNPECCLVAVYLRLSRGSLQKNALICLPKSGDISNVKSLSERPHRDPNEKLRKQTRAEHAKTLKKLRKLRIRRKKKSLKTPVAVSPKNNAKKPNVKLNREPSDYMKRMRELWLPSNIDTVRNVCSRETMGYVTQGAFSFTEAHSCAIGYVAYNALRSLLETAQNKVLVRNLSSTKYNLAKIEVVQYV